MNNYEYIVASLPDLTPDWKFPEGTDTGALLEFIRDNCSERDRAFMDLLSDGFREERLNEDFYRRALRSGNRFIRDYFTFDLHLRNAKAAFLNKALGRAEGQDIFLRPEGEFEELPQVEEILAEKDPLARERRLTGLIWKKIDSLILFDYFDMNRILAFIAKLHHASRWLSLDEAAGRVLFRRLAEEVRSGFKGIPQS